MQCKLLESYFHSKEWSVKNTNYVMMLQYDDCIYNYKLEDDENVDICFISSFVLPVNNNELEKQFEETKQKFRELKATLNVIKSLKNDLLKLEQLNHEYIKKDQRSIETLGIFTAIIAFIVSTVGNFKFVENVVEAIAFMTTLASSLCIFLGVLLIIIDRNRIKSHLSKWFLLFNVCLNIIGWSYLILK